MLHANLEYVVFIDKQKQQLHHEMIQKKNTNH